MDSIKLLIVEDNPSDIRLVKELLLEYGQLHFTFIEANRLESAIDLFKGEKIDIVLLDLGLPDSQGLDSFIRINQIVGNTPIIILSGLEDEAVATAAVSHGAQDYLIKGRFDGRLLANSITYAIERKKFEKSLREYAAIVESADVAIISATLTGEITSWNKTAETIFGYQAKEVLGRHISVLSPNDEVDDTSRLLETVKSGTTVRQYETLKVTKDQNKINVVITASPIKDASEKITGISLIMSDITARKLLEQQIAIQYRIAIALSEAINISNASHSILKSICEILNWQIGEMWLIDKKDNLLKYITGWQTQHEYDEFEAVSKKLSLYKGLGLPGLIWDQKKVYWSNEIKQEITKRKEALNQFGLNHCFGFPILVQGEFLGVMVFFSHATIQPSPSFVTLFTSVSDQVGTFIRRKLNEENLFYIAQHDLLTGLANRSVFDDNLQSSMINANLHHTMVALLYLDIDYFKKINDAYGHTRGDKVLCEIGKRLKEVLRDTDTLARFSGDEFVILLPEITTIDEIEILAKNIHRTIAEPFLIDEKEFYITVSAGISIYPTDGKDFESLLKNADTALLYAKENGRNNYQFCTPNVTSLAEQRVHLENQLHHAIKKNEFRLYYQPIIEIKSSDVIGMEALIRWYHPDGRIILPSEFIPIIEQSSLIAEVGNWVIKTACLQAKQCHEIGFRVDVSVNIASNQLNHNFITTVSKILNETKLAPKHLVIELTETSFMRETEVNIQLLLALKKLGLALHIDDFGTGYSSLGYLKNFAVDCLKIDRSFIMETPRNQNLATIVTAIIAMAHALNIKTIAEGVETEEQLNFLRGVGCDYCQGFYFSKPLPADELINFLKSHNPAKTYSL